MYLHSCSEDPISLISSDIEISTLEANSTFKHQGKSVELWEKHKIKQIYIWNPMTTGFVL